MHRYSSHQSINRSTRQSIDLHVNQSNSRLLPLGQIARDRGQIGVIDERKPAEPVISTAVVQHGHVGQGELDRLLPHCSVKVLQRFRRTL